MLHCSSCRTPLFQELDHSKKSVFRLVVAFLVSIFIHAIALLTTGQGLHSGSHITVSHGMQNGAIHALLTDLPLPPQSQTDHNPPTNHPADEVLHDQAVRPEAPASNNENKSPPAPSKSSTSTDAEPSAGSFGMDAPVLELPFAPRYPIQLMVKGVRGSVTASFKVGRSGVPEDVEIIDSSPPGAFDSAVIDALQQARFSIDAVRPNSAWITTIIFDPSGTRSQGKNTQSVLRPKP